jgi:hypothetical protein
MGDVWHHITIVPLWLESHPYLFRHNIASLTDFMCIRFNQSFGLPALITLVCVVGVTPYIALQLDSISSTAQILLPSSTLVTDNVNWFVALSMAAFALYTQYTNLMPSVNVSYIKDQAFGHQFPTDKKGSQCGLSEKPFIGQCNYDAAGQLLTHL